MSARVRLAFALLVLLAWAAAALAEPPGFATSSPITPEREWAVLVGVSKYAALPQDEWLRGADADAAAMAAFLRSPRGGAFPADHVRLLLDEDATIGHVRRALDQLIKRVQRGDVVYVFFACHAKVEWYGGGEIGYLLMADSELDALNATALPMDELRRYVDVHLRQASQVVLITDACHAGALGRSPDDPASRLVGSASDHLLDIGERSGVLNLMACRRDEQAVEDADLGGHGVLTWALLRALNGDAGSSAGGVVRVQDVLEYVMREVPRVTDQRQHPRHSSNYVDDFPMARLALPGPELDLPRPREVAGWALPGGQATLRVVGAPVDSEVFLVQGRDLRTVGRVLSADNVLVLEGIPPGRYTLLQRSGRKDVTWPLVLERGVQTFDVRKGGTL